MSEPNEESFGFPDRFGGPRVTTRAMVSPANFELSRHVPRGRKDRELLMIEADLLRAELERLYELDELVALSRDLLGFDPERVGGTAAKASFAGALTSHCVEQDAVEALCDVLLATRANVSAQVADIRLTGLHAEEELKPGTDFGDFTVVRKLGEGRLAISYVVKRGSAEYRLKLLRREATRDARGLHRFLTVTRLAGKIAHPGLPQGVAAITVDGRTGIVHEYIDGQPLAQRLARTGPIHINEARPLVKGILQALSALHEQRVAHGDLRLENLLLTRGADGEPRVVLVDAGSDRLRARARANNGRAELFSTVGSPSAVSPEQIRGLVADPSSDVYSLGAVLYQILSGKPVFGDKPALETAFGHLMQDPAPPSSVAPRGWIPRELDELVLSLLDKNVSRRPKDAKAVLELFEGQGRAAEQKREQLSSEEIERRIDSLLADPSKDEAALELEAAASTTGAAEKVAEAFKLAAQSISGAGDEATDTKKSLLFRAARVYQDTANKLDLAEGLYAEILAIDPQDQVAQRGLEEARRKLGKFEELIEMLLGQSERAESNVERGRAFAEIGKLYAGEMADKEQALVAFTQSFCEDPEQAGVVSELERLCGSSQQSWGELLSSCQSTVDEGELPSELKSSISLKLGRWYIDKLQRPDLALPCFQSVVENDPGNDVALEGMTQIYRKAQQWQELGMVLTRRADAAKTPAQARDMRAEAAEILEQYLNDNQSARALYEQILADDPGHGKASDAIARIYERTADFTNLVKHLVRRSEAQRGDEKLRSLTRIAEVYETQLHDDTEAIRRYKDVLLLDAHHPEALRGLDRVYSKLGRFQDLLENLRLQIEAAATPRQKVTLWERIAALYEEEFLDPKQAAEAFENVLKLDANGENALTALVRLYRGLERWEEAASIYERHIKLVSETPRRLALILARAKLLADQVGSPDRAISAYEQALEIDPHHPTALETLAKLRESSGDSGAAVAAIEALAAKATTPEAKAEQWVRAAKLLESRGDKDGAIARLQKALDANPRDANASQLLRVAFAARGDHNAAVQLIERELGQTEGELARAKLAGELARLLRDGVRDDKRAEDAARRALGFDPTNLDALVVLGDISFEAKRALEAAKHYEGVVGRADMLERTEAIRVLVHYVDALSQTGSTEKALAPMDTLLRIAPDDQQALERVALVTFENGSPKRAAELFGDLLQRFGERMSETHRGQAQYRLGEALRQAGNVEGARKPLEDAADADPSSALPLIALSKIYESEAKWLDVIKVKTRHLDIASGDQRVELLIEIGDICGEKLNDRAGAAKSFVAALEDRPDDRKLLTKLMQLYSEEKDWNKLVEVVLRLAEFVDDPKQKVKYLHTAAIVTARQAGDVDRALEFYEQVLKLEPHFDKALNEAVELERERRNWDGVERVLKRRLDAATEANDRTAMLQSFQQLGELYEKNLGLMDQAIDAYEAAQTLEPENKERSEHLGGLYATDPEKYLDKAVASQALLLRQNPFRPESYKALRRLYTETKQADASWCLCQTLSVLNLAEPDEERFYKRMKSDTAAPAQSTLGDEEWLVQLMHADADALLSSVFALIEPAVIARRSQTAQELGYDTSYLVDVTQHPAPVCQSLYYAAGVLGMPVPPAFENPNDPGGLSFLFTHEPALVLGKTALRTDVPLQPAGFIAGQQLTYLRPGLYLRHLLASGTVLKAWFFAAIKLTSPQFPVSPELEGAVAEAMSALEAGVTGQARDHLTRVVAKLLTSGAALDLKRWVRGVDLTADRVGFLLCHDLETATQIIKASDESTSSVSTDERLKELVLFSVSSNYFALRQQLGIAVDS
jgi:tetratricopeptide (TPR) repeat protein/tRNA A-37 threonylcarbamoyl transferase component Bud32